MTGNVPPHSKKIVLLHRHTIDRIQETNAAFPYLRAKGIDILTFKKFPRTGGVLKFWKSLFWIFYAPFLVAGKGYDVIYLDDSYPFYGIFVKMACPRAKIVKRLGDLHLMYFCTGWLYQFLHFFEKIEWLMMDEIVTISGVMSEFVFNQIRQPTFAVFDPVDPNEFPYFIGKNHGTVMFHGLLTKNKNIDILLEAAKLLPHITFVIVGDGPDRKRLENKATVNVIFKGWIQFSDVKKMIQTCACGVALRSNNPGNEYVVTSPFLQYGIMGKPCLVTRRKVFKDYEWQFSSVEEMVKKIQMLLKHPEEGWKLRDRIIQHHRADIIADQIWDILTA